ncbi:unnamed protein product [Trichobilharzia szidati]|nr:unnamed protein product [Trichobilharzia szidati]
MQLFYQAVFGFAYHESDTDPDSPSDLSDSEEDCKPKIRHPGESIKKRKTKPSKIKKKRQWEKDLFHPDAYPWKPRPKRAPRDGISWTVRVYFTDSPSGIPKSENIASLRFRKLSYMPRIISIEHMDPPSSKTDYCLAIGPRAGRDAGVITLLAKIDRAIYCYGEPVQCDIKLHNSSIRLIHSIVAEIHQCVRSKACVNRILRTVICSRSITDLSLVGGMPVLPGSENSHIRLTLNPWPTYESVQKLMKKPEGPIRPSGLADPSKAWAFRLPKTPGHEYALEAPGRHERVPPQYMQRRTLAQSTFSGLYDYLLSKGDNVTILKPLGEEKEGRIIWEGNPHAHCRCTHHVKEPGEISRIYQIPPEEPYSAIINCKDVYPEDEEPNEARARRNLLQPLCRQCKLPINVVDYPVQVTYEVVIQAKLLPQHLKNPLSCESAIREAGLGSGLLIDPYGDIIGPDGPRIVIPLFLGYKYPHPEERIPIANYHVDLRQDCADETMREPKIHEPSLGKGFFISKTYPIAPCNIGEK